MTQAPTSLSPERGDDNLTGAEPDIWGAYTLPDLDAIHEALTKADDAMAAIYSQPRTDIDGPAGAFLFAHLEGLRCGANRIVDAARARIATTPADLDAQWHILARAAAGLDNPDIERALIAALVTRHQIDAGGRA